MPMAMDYSSLWYDQHTSFTCLQLLIEVSTAHQEEEQTLQGIENISRKINVLQNSLEYDTWVVISW